MTVLRLVMIWSTCLGISTASFALNWQSYLPLDGLITADVMTLSSSDELVAITNKLRHAMSNHPHWFQEVMDKLKPGEVMPYHPKMGISRQEYFQFRQFNHHLELRKVATLHMKFQSLANGQIKIVCQEKSPIDGLIISQNSVKTPYGEAHHRVFINNHDYSSPIGPWQGLQWSSSHFEEKALNQHDLGQFKATEVNFSIGQRQGGHGMLHYSVRDIDIDARKNSQLSYLLFYPAG